MEGNALASLLCVHRTMEHCTFQFHSTIISLLHHDQYGYLSVRFYIHWYFRVTSTWLYIIHISWIYIYMLFLYEYYTFIFVLSFLILRHITNILYYLLSDAFLMSDYTTFTWPYQAYFVLLACFDVPFISGYTTYAFEDIWIQRKQSSENTH